MLEALDVWMIVAGALVLLMTPGLAFFYGGLTQTKSALNMMMMSFASIGIVAVVWALWGYSVAEGEGIAHLFGNPGTDFGLYTIVSEAPEELIGVGFGATFAIITTALISGAIADRAKFSAWLVFVPVWVTLVYCPLAFWVWGDGLLTTGPIGSFAGEAVDYAGGLVVHMCAGVAALVLALVLGKRRTFSTPEKHKPHNVPFVLLGASVLWFGWFGFNGGAAEDAGQAGVIWINTLLAPAAALVAWILTLRLSGRRPTAMGVASGIVAGLVAITPACAYVDPVGAIVLGAVAGVLCCLAINLKYKLGYDDSLDVVGLHFVAGLWGTVAIGLLGRGELLAIDEFDYAGGLFYGGGLDLLWAQLVASLVTLTFTLVATAIIAYAIHATIGFRVSTEVESVGIDTIEHAEEAYIIDSAAAASPSQKV
ncbi:ammonium transporter [Garicola koreensis]|uniref:Ammonium transporter n=1 Tax=Garicola koreensis TaxID=1262554 RepID=A0A7W5TTB5_9MICC|nr:Amt family ammonium transporter [Garicola koreensis]